MSTPEVAHQSAGAGVLVHMQPDRASYLMLTTIALATLSTVFFLLAVAEVPGGVLFAVVVGIAAMRPLLRQRDMNLTAPVLTVPRAQHVMSLQPGRFTHEATTRRNPLP